MQLSERFLKKVDSSGSCWVWLACKSGGYGSFWVGDRKTGRQVLAHRVAWELFKGPIPEGKTLDHLCRNRACVNPDHLEPVTSVENVMRGAGFSAKNARKTHCPRGHEYTAENTRILKKGWRVCRQCEKIRPNLRHE